MADAVTPGRVVACVVGTRPEAVKMAPIVLRLARGPRGSGSGSISTGQHRELLDRALADFGLVADRDLGLMRPGQSLAEVTARALTALDEAFEAERPDLVLAQGDTTTVLASALASVITDRIPFGHVEAGLEDRPARPAVPRGEEPGPRRPPGGASLRPDPGEHDSICSAKGSPTPRSTSPAIPGSTPSNWRSTARPRRRSKLEANRMILVTAHRRESFGEPLARSLPGASRPGRARPPAQRGLPGPSQPVGPRSGRGDAPGNSPGFS